MIPLQGVFDWINGLTADVKTTIMAVVVTGAIVFIAYQAFASKLSVAKIIGAVMAAGFLIAATGGIDVVSGWFTNELK